MKEIRIDNSKQSAVKSGKWKNPGSSFYYKILNSFTIADPKRSEADPDRYDFDFRKVLQEAYLIAPVEKIKNSPYGITPYSQSGCKYPHHVIRNGKLVVSIPGIQAAYARAKQQGIYKGKVKEHIDRHYKEMGLTMSTMTESVDPIQDQIDDNFESIQRYLEESLDISFVHPDVVLESTEHVDPQQTIQETFDWMDQILYQSDEEYNASLVGSSLFEEKSYEFDSDHGLNVESVVDRNRPLKKDIKHHPEMYGKVSVMALIESNFDDIMDTLCTQNDSLMEIASRDSNSEAALMEYIETMFGTGKSDMEQFTESTDEEYDIPKEELDKIAKDPKSLSTWMKRNFQYDKSIATWRLKSPIEMLHSKKGNCHDQSLFTMYALSLMGYQSGQVFFIEFKEGSSEGGNTHSLTWYKDGNQVFWLENAWEPFAGIHGPYKDIYALKWDVFKCFCKDNDINSGKFDGIMFTRSMPYSSRKMRAKIGQSLGEYVENQTLQENHKFYFFNRKEEEIKETFDWMDQILYQSDEEYNASLVSSSLFEEMDPLFDLSSTIELNDSDIEELDFEEKYSAIDATESEWNEFWSLFERGELHKTKSQMINYYNQYLEYIEAIGNSSEDEIANAHQYKEKIDEMRSDPEYDSWMRRMDLDDMLYAEHRLSQLEPISDEEFIKELLENKAGMLALTDPDDTELIERYQNEIAYLVDCKLNPSVALDEDAINWEYLNLIRYGMNEAVNVDALMRQISNFIENHFSTAIIHYQDIALPYLLKSYILYERTSTIPDVKYSYRLGIDVDTGKLVAIKFKLEPDKITKVGNAAGHLDAYLSKHPEERRQYEQLNQKLKQFKQAGNTDAANKIEHQLKVFEDNVEANANHHKFLNKDGKVTTLVDTLKNVITRTGHIDFVSGDNEIVGIIYHDGKVYTMKNGKGKKVRILPAQSEQVGDFLGRMRNYDPDLMQKFMIRNPSNYIPRSQNDGQVVSLPAAFADPKVQNLFISFVKQFRYQPEVYEIGKTCGPNKYQSTRVLWNNVLLYRKLGDTPQFRGPILDLEVKSINRVNPKTQKYEINYTGLGSPEFIKKESYESGNLNTIIDGIKNNIRKYEETVQNINTHTRECNNEFITVNPNDGIKLRENTWNHFMKLINDSENKFGLARSNNHHLGLVESIDEDTDFSDKNTISLIEEYASFVERNSSLKHEYRMGIDTNNGRLVAIEFDLDPNRIVKVGNHVAFNNANSYSADPINYFLAFLQNKRDSAKTEEERDSWNRQINDTENKIYQRKSDEALAELKKSIKRTGHIDYVSKGGKVTNIFYYDGTGSGKHTKGPITMIPVLSPELNGFIRYLDSMNPAYLAYQKNPEQGYNILNDRFIKHRQTNPSNYNDKNKYIYSLTSLFTDSEIQKLFVKYVKDHHINGETYQVGESYSKDERFKTTKILWDALWMYRKFTYNPVFRGTIPTYDLENNRKNASRYNGLNKPREAKKKKPIKESNTELLDSIYEALYPLDPRSYEAMNSLLYDEYLEALELHGIDVSAILNSKLPEDINLISEITSNIDWLLSNKSNPFNMDLSSYLEADDPSEENDQVEDNDTPPNIDLGDEEIESDESPTTDTDEPESTEEDTPTEDETEEDSKEDTSNEAPNIIEPTSLPKAADAQETDKNGVNRKKLYIAFIEWAKSYNARNTFGSLFDKDVFDVTYPFVPHEMRYFYRLANPILCVLSGKLTFFQVSELRKLNADNPDMKDALIFAATENDYRAFSTRDKRVYLAIDKPDGSGIQFTRALADSFDLYIQNMIGKGDILHGDVDSSTDSGTDRGDHSDENGE